MTRTCLTAFLKRKRYGLIGSAVNETLKSLLLHISHDPSMGHEEALALARLARDGMLTGPVVLPPLLLNASEAAKFLGVSADTFLRARAEHPALLSPLTTYAGGKMWAKVQLIEFSISHLRNNEDKDLCDDRDLSAGNLAHDI